LGLYVGGYKRDTDAGDAAHAARREAQAVVPAFCCLHSTAPSPHLRTDVFRSPAVSIPARRDTSAAVGSFSLTPLHSIFVSTSKVQQITQTRQRQDEGEGRRWTSSPTRTSTTDTHTPRFPDSGGGAACTPAAVHLSG
jgi:hypothetical protein